MAILIFALSIINHHSNTTIYNSDIMLHFIFTDQPAELRNQTAI